MNLFDLSNYAKDSKFYDLDNEKVIGKMKDNSKGKIIDEFVGLKSKRYSIKDADGKENKTAKGMNQNVVKNTEHQEYVDFLFNKNVVKLNMKRIQSKLQRIGTCDVCKIYLSFFDDKRCILDDSINSLAYFHKDTRS